MASHRSAVVFEGDIGFRDTELPAERGFPALQLFETDDPGHATHPGKAVKPSGLSMARLSSGILRRSSARFHLDDHVAPLTWSEPRWLPPEPPADTEIALIGRSSDLHPVGDGMPDESKPMATAAGCSGDEVTCRSSGGRR
jgi:hypothetical protein